MAHTARLIDMLSDPDPGVERAAHAALRTLSGEDFGPVLNATEAERERAATAWRDWWERTKIAS